MIKQISKIFILSILILSFYGCEVVYQAPDLTGKKFALKVDIKDAPQSSETNRLTIPYTEEDTKITLEISLVDYYGTVLKQPLNRVAIIPENGKAVPKYIDPSVFVDGKAVIEVSLVNTYGSINIVAEEDEGIVGVSDKQIHFKPLSILNIQKPANETDPSSSSPFYYNFVKVDETANQNLMVLHASGSGMYIIDLDRMTDADNSGACMIKQNGKWVKNPAFVTGNGGYNTVYIYSRNAPVNYDDESSEAGLFDFLKAGHKLEWFAGNLVEFPPSFTNGMTEISFPIWSIKKSEFLLTDDQIKTRLAQVPICDLEPSDYPIGNDQIKILERYESNLVRVKNVKIGAFDADNRDYKRYHQWQIVPEGGAGKMSVASIESAAEFDEQYLKGNPTGKDLLSITGIMHQVYGDIWIIYVRNKCDIKVKDAPNWNTWLDEANGKKCPEVCGDNWNDEVDCN